jgi:fused signal recognition particle receptor
MASLMFWRKKRDEQGAVENATSISEEIVSEDLVSENLAAASEALDEAIDATEIIETPEEAQPVIQVADVQPVNEPYPTQALEAVELPKRSFSRSIKSLFGRVKFDLQDLEALEDTLIQADFGVDTAANVVAELKARARRQGVSDEAALKGILVELLTEKLTRDDSALNLSDAQLPYVLLVVGVNGVGKTTTIGKLSKWLVDGGWRVTLGAADTFRAAAVDQLATWAERAGATIVKPKTEGQDPASVAFETLELAISQDSDVVIIDTAGRLQNKTDLMDELGKIRRVVEKRARIAEVLLVIDATTGQNALTQAKAFAEIASVTGIVLTKLDGTAKGGIVFAIQEQLDIPVKLVGVGEGVEDFAFFDAAEFANALIND